MPADSRAPKNAELGGGAPPARVVSGLAPSPGTEETAHARGPASDGVAAEITRAVVAAEEPPASDTDPAGLPLAAPTEPVLADDEDPTLREEIPAELARPLEDEVSIPPVGDLVVEEFFSEGDVGAHLGHEVDEPVLDAKIARKSAPDVVERRTRLARYVRWAVAGASALCLVALGRGLVASRAPALAAEVKPASAVIAFADPPAAAAKEATPEPAKAEPAKAEAATGAEPAKADGVPEQPAAEGPKSEPAVEAKPAAAELDPKAAAVEKAKARRALESGRLAAAIAAGEASVALDPSDGEAWLLLGAAHQEKGSLAEARRAYTACVKQGKRGPIAECSAMLR